MDQTSISAIIIDDEPEAINLLEMFLRSFPFIRVIGKECNAKKGLNLAKETLPELIFLDIDMPDMNGLTLAAKLLERKSYSEIVFTTAHQHYAYDALDIEPLDFLTKPFSIIDLENVIQKFRKKKEKEEMDQKLTEFVNNQTNANRIKLPTTTGILFIDIRNIVFLKSKSNNCDLFLEDGSIETITRNLYKVATLLNSSMFFQISRAIYINLNYLQRVDKKNLKFYIYYNNMIIEESVTRSCMLLFEKTGKFPIIQE